MVGYPDLNSLASGAPALDPIALRQPELALHRRRQTQQPLLDFARVPVRKRRFSCLLEGGMGQGKTLGAAEEVTACDLPRALADLFNSHLLLEVAFKDFANQKLCSVPSMPPDQIGAKQRCRDNKREEEDPYAGHDRLLLLLFLCMAEPEQNVGAIATSVQDASVRRRLNYVKCIVAEQGVLAR